MFANQESDQEASSESDDSDKSKERPQSKTATKITNMSCSMIMTNHSSSQLAEYSMTQSFNEKLIHETCILEDGMGELIDFKAGNISVNRPLLLFYSINVILISACFSKLQYLFCLICSGIYSLNKLRHYYLQPGPSSVANVWNFLIIK